MKIRKTRHDLRSTYTYHFDNGESCKLMAGENGVTEADIKHLHAEDDSEVYYNNKNLRPERTDEEKAIIKVWRNDYIEKTTKERGDIPSKDEVDDDKLVFQFKSGMTLDLKR